MLKENYYLGVDEMPYYNWRKCQGGEFEFIRREVDKGSEDDDAKAWGLLYDDYINIFGLGKEYEYYLDLMKEKALLLCDLIIDDNNVLQNRINVIEFELEEIRKKGEDDNTDKGIIYLSKWMGYRLNPKEITVNEFYTMLQEYKKEAEKMK